MKWVLNAISTGAHIISGKVLGNKMIDLKVRYVHVCACILKLAELLYSQKLAR